MGWGWNGYLWAPVGANIANSNRHGLQLIEWLRMNFEVVLVKVVGRVWWWCESTRTERAGAGWGLCRHWSLRGLRPGLARHPPVSCLCTQVPTQTPQTCLKIPHTSNTSCPKIPPKYIQSQRRTVQSSWILRDLWPGLARHRPVTGCCAACTNPDSLYFPWCKTAPAVCFPMYTTAGQWICNRCQQTAQTVYLQ